ncbi:Olfactory receptor 7G1 [Sciurus carolinensis]|uniref:Olfactory receptor 7G1 n=1 Tax=Sciurus carolinensis TaxID=30640 RepID=A0AA41MLV7_SCICA|nr:Olfactory receptor 7G1 [Sciurus carolinensis]
MNPKNQTAISKFRLLGLTEDPSLQTLIFSLFLSMYLDTILGNLLIILAVSSDPHLHTPMYFFLSNLSFTDICLSTCTVPKLLLNIQYRTLGSPPPHSAVAEAVLLLSPGDPHFFCELAQFLKLACSDTFINNTLIYFAALMFGGLPLSGIIFSYIHIVSSVLRMPSSEGKHKSFSTCGSHLSVVSLFYGTGFGVYICSSMTDSSRKAAVASLMYTVVPQMLKPLIYSLRNRDMKEAFRKLTGQTTSLL